MVAEPLNKKRKLQVNGNGAAAKQPSFTDVLEQLEAEGDDAGGEQLLDTYGCSKLMDQIPSRRMLHGLDRLYQDLTRRKTRFVCHRVAAAVAFS